MGNFWFNDNANPNTFCNCSLMAIRMIELHLSFQEDYEVELYSSDAFTVLFSIFLGTLHGYIRPLADLLVGFTFGGTCGTRQDFHVIIHPTLDI